MSRAASVLRYHGHMVGDRGRIRAYRAALSELVKPGHVVVDVGAGTGILSVFACQAGAARVHAIEPADIVSLGRELVKRAGTAEQVCWHKAPAQQVWIQDKAEVIVCGVGLNEGLLSLAIDARARFGNDESKMIPADLAVAVAPVEAPELHEKRVGFWKSHHGGFDLSALKVFAASQVYEVVPDEVRLAAEAETIATVKLAELKTPHLAGRAKFKFSEPAKLHGWVSWLSTRLSPSVEWSNPPHAPSKSYALAFFPLLAPLEIPGGCEVELLLDLYDGVVARWETRVQGGPIEVRSTFDGFPESRAELLRPSLTNDERRKAAAAARTLRWLDGRTAAAALATRVRSEFPELFGSDGAALRFVERWIEHYAE